MPVGKGMPPVPVGMGPPVPVGTGPPVGKAPDGKTPEGTPSRKVSRIRDGMDHSWSVW